MYGIQGNEGEPDQNINHFINAIRHCNKPEAFKVKADTLDRAANSLISGRDASNTELVAGMDLWIPSFGVAAKLDVGSGTLSGEVNRTINRIDQGIKDYRSACKLAANFIPAIVKQHVTNDVEGFLEGLLDFAIKAAEILAGSTSIGALIGAFFGGVGAVPGAEIGFELGMYILNYYGLVTLAEAILGMAGNLVSELFQFLNLIVIANGDQGKLEVAAYSLAEGVGTLVEAILMVLIAEFTKKGLNTLSKTKFAQIVGEQPLMKWLQNRQMSKTTNETFNHSKNGANTANVEPVSETQPKGSQVNAGKSEIINGERVVVEEPTTNGHKVKVTEKGNCLVCSECETTEEIRAKYEKLLQSVAPGVAEQITAMLQRLEASENILDAEKKAETVKTILEDLESLEKTVIADKATQGTNTTFSIKDSSVRVPGKSEPASSVAAKAAALKKSDWTDGKPVIPLIKNNGTQYKGKFPDRANPNKILYRQDANGDITNYQVYDQDGLPIKRVDLTGKSHGGIETPHVVEFEDNVNPNTGQPFRKPQRNVRPAKSNEIPYREQF